MGTRSAGVFRSGFISPKYSGDVALVQSFDGDYIVSEAVASWLSSAGPTFTIPPV